MNKKGLVIALFVVMSISAISPLVIYPKTVAQTSDPQPTYSFFTQGIDTMIKRLWTPSLGAFTDSPGVNFFWWTDDQAKALLDLSQNLTRYGTYCSSIINFLDNYQFNGMVVRRLANLTPQIVQYNPTNFIVNNNGIIQIQGDLSNPTGMKFLIKYQQSDCNMTCIQGQSIRYNWLEANSVFNPSMESGTNNPDYWYSGSNAYWSTAQARTGIKSLLLNVSSANAEWRAQYFLVSGNASYQVQGYFKGNVTADEFFLTIRWFSNGDGTGFISETNIPIPTGTYSDWTLFSADKAAPSNALSADIVFRAISGTGKLYGDDFSVRKKGVTEYPADTAITSYYINDRRPNHVDLIQVHNDGKIKVTFNYTIAKGKPYILFTSKVENVWGISDLTGVYIHNAFDQLDQFGVPTGAGQNPLGYRYIYFPGVGDVAANSTVPQHFLPQSNWNGDYFVIHMRDIPDIFDRSLAIAVILGNKTSLTAIDNVLAPTPDELHWLKMYYSLGDISAGSSTQYTAKYVLLNAHDWTNMAGYDQFFSNIDSFNNVDLSLDHQYGTILYGLAEYYYQSGLNRTFVERIWNYWYRMFTSSGNGSYMQSFPYAIIATYRLYQKTGNSTYSAVAKSLVDKMLERQQMDDTKANYGGFREWGGAQYSYLDYTAPAGDALGWMYQATGNATYQTRKTIASNSVHIDSDGSLYCYRDQEGTQKDTDIMTYKASMFLPALALGVNDTLANYAMCRVWQKLHENSTDTGIWVAPTGESFGQEINTETQSWSLRAWLAYAQDQYSRYGLYIRSVTASRISPAFYLTGVSWSGQALTLTTEGSSAGTLLQIYGGSRGSPTYVLEAGYELSPGAVDSLSLGDSASKNIVVSYAEWGDFYVKGISSGWMTDASWSGQKLTLTLNGSSSTGILTVYCGSRGLPNTITGLTGAEYSTTTKILSGTVQFASPVTALDWTVSVTGPGGGSEGGGPSVVRFMVSTLRLSVPQGQTISGLLAFNWTGVNDLTVTNVRFQNSPGWLMVAEPLPKTVTKQMETLEGSGSIAVRITVPADASVGDYSVVAEVDATGPGGNVASSGYVNFTVVQPSNLPSPVSDLMALLFVLILGIFVAYVYFFRR